MEQKFTYDNYYRDWNKRNKEKRRGYQRDYLEKQKTSIIYKIIDSNDDEIYIGSTDIRFRMNLHKTGNTHLHITEEDNVTILYTEVENVNREELYYIEYYLIGKENPTKNTAKIELDKFEFSLDKQIELETIANNLEFKEYN